MNARLEATLRNPELITPALALDFDHIDHTYLRFLHAFPNGLVYYAMKANANPQVIAHLSRLGSGFEIASLAELELVLAAGASGERIICSNPIKNPQFLKRMHQVGVYAMVVDSTYEVEKVAQYAPGARVYIRLAVDNSGSVLPLAGKFGVDGATALDLCDMAREFGLQPIGIMFHVGSQCLQASNWVNAIQAAGDVWHKAAARGHHFTFLDLGGGYPAGHYHTPSIPTIEDIGRAVTQAVKDYIPATDDLMLILEPGRAMVAEGGRLVTTVVGKAQRGDEMWLYLDAGVFNGLMETMEGFPPVVQPLDDEAMVRPMRMYTLAGPSCDSCDVIARRVELPEVHINDRLVFFDAGAYTNEYAAAFNGFPIPQFIALEAVCEEVVVDLTPN
ncbi:MAG: type III PLP-dependent enzyme [Chloroflexota bacterium]|nr:type III PLP-dependent enzyme [Chloroflexota bacterium]